MILEKLIQFIFPYRFVLAFAVSSLSYNYSLGFHDQWYLLWIAPLPLCLVALNRSPGFTFFMTVSAYILGVAPQLWDYSHTPLPAAIFLISVAINAVAFAGFLLFYRLIFRHPAGPSLSSFIFAAGWTGYEWLRSLGSPNGTIESIAYSQAFNLPVIQFASLVGIWGISFLLILIPAAFAAAWQHRHNQRLFRQILVPPCCLFLLVLIFGTGRLLLPEERPPVTVGLTAVSVTMDQYIAARMNRDTQ